MLHAVYLCLVIVLAVSPFVLASVGMLYVRRDTTLQASLLFGTAAAIMYAFMFLCVLDPAFHDPQDKGVYEILLYIWGLNAGMVLIAALGLFAFTLVYWNRCALYTTLGRVLTHFPVPPRL